MSDLKGGGARLQGDVSVPGDKSISHRLLLLGALAEGESTARGFLPSGDTQATLDCLGAMGVEVLRHDESTLTVRGRGLAGLRPPSGPLNCGRSGTTMRLMAGLLAGQRFASELTGDPQLLERPMRRVVEPLRSMGAEIEDVDGHAPLAVGGLRPGARLAGSTHQMTVASAQVKSALLLAGLNADGDTVVKEIAPTRDHTERMLEAMGAKVQVDGLEVRLRPLRALAPLDIVIPGDFSSAAFLIAAAACSPGSELTIRNVGINPTRTGLLDVLASMGADIKICGHRMQGAEPVADLIVRGGALQAVVIGDPALVARMIDEFPALAVAASQARGRTVVRGAAELRVKETDRIATVVTELSRLGARIESLPDGFSVIGPTRLQGAMVTSHGDHRLAMSLMVAGVLANDGETQVYGAACAADSFPGFASLLRELTR